MSCTNGLDSRKKAVCPRRYGNAETDESFDASPGPTAATAHTFTITICWWDVSLCQSDCEGCKCDLSSAAEWLQLPVMPALVSLMTRMP